MRREAGRQECNLYLCLPQHAIKEGKDSATMHHPYAPATHVRPPPTPPCFCWFCKGVEILLLPHKTREMKPLALITHGFCWAGTCVTSLFGVFRVPFLGRGSGFSWSRSGECSASQNAIGASIGWFSGCPEIALAVFWCVLQSTDVFQRFDTI